MTEPQRLEKLLVAVDGSEQSVRATELALAIAEAMGARVHFLNFVEIAEVPSLISETEEPGGEEQGQLALGMSMSSLHRQAFPPRQSSAKGTPPPRY